MPLQPSPAAVCLSATRAGILLDCEESQRGSGANTQRKETWTEERVSISISNLVFNIISVCLDHKD